jgi:hypothetical protein
VTKVKVSFTDASGHLINAGYTDHARAKGKKEGQTVQRRIPAVVATLATDGWDRIGFNE